MKALLVSGWHLIPDRAECLKWMDKYSIYYKSFPESYPVHVRLGRNRDETSYPIYIQQLDAEGMAKELLAWW